MTKTQKQIRISRCLDASFIAYNDGAISEKEWEEESCKALYYCVVEEMDGINELEGKEIDDFCIHADDVSSFDGKNLFDENVQAEIDAIINSRAY